MLPKALVPLSFKVYPTLPTPIMTKLDKFNENNKTYGVKVNTKKVPKDSLCPRIS